MAVVAGGGTASGPAPGRASRLLSGLSGLSGNGLARYAARRTLTALGTTVFVVVANFFLFRMLPGDPVGLYTRGRNVPPEQIARLRARYEEPLATQFWSYVRNPFSAEIPS